MTDFREISKGSFNSLHGKTIEAINAGSLQRIADATEVMAKNYISLQNDRDYYKRRCSEKDDKIAKLERKNIALRGHITRLRNLCKKYFIL